MNHEQYENRILRMSFIVSMAFTLTEVLAGFLIHSNTVIMDGIFDLADLILLGPFLILVPLLYKPVTEKHPYGYSQVESVFLIIKYAVLLAVTALLIYNNIRIILEGGNEVDTGAVLVYEVLMSIFCLIFFLLLRRFNKRYESPTLKAELYMWKTDVVGSVSVSIAFLLQLLLRKVPFVESLTAYMDSAVAIILALFLIREPIDSLKNGIRELMLFAPDEETMDKIRSAVDRALDGLPYTCDFLDVILTGRKVWIEVYLTVDLQTSLIDTRHWQKIRRYIRNELKDEFDQLYIELIPSIDDEPAPEVDEVSAAITDIIQANNRN